MRRDAGAGRQNEAADQRGERRKDRTDRGDALGRKQGAVEIAYVIVLLHLGAELELVGTAGETSDDADLAEMRQVVMSEEIEIAVQRYRGNCQHAVVHAAKNEAEDFVRRAEMRKPRRDES